jgi:L-iditol 2-dehydrogenase
MKAIIKYAEGTGKVDFLDVEEKLCGDYEVVVEVRAAGICMTDIHIVNDLYPWELFSPLGHEFSGVVVEAGKVVTRFKVGDRVTTCKYGGFAKYAVKNENDLIFKLPDNLSFDEGAMIEPLAAAAFSVINRSKFKVRDFILIEGAGTLGLCAMQVVKAMGGVVAVSGTSRSLPRIELAKKLGADYTINIDKINPVNFIMDVTKGKGADAIFECAGTQAALDTGLGSLKNGGVLTQIGLYSKNPVVDLNSIVCKNQQIIGSIGYESETWMKCIELVKDRIIDVQSLITHRLPLTEWKKGFDMVERREGLKIILNP